jgi:hypothetical protein
MLFLLKFISNAADFGVKEGRKMIKDDLYRFTFLVSELSLVVYLEALSIEVKDLINITYEIIFE